MDHDDKIKKAAAEDHRDLVEHSKLVFLREIVDEFRRKNTLYDLGQEFAKTKKNRSPIVPLVVLGVSMLFLVGAVSVTLYIQEEEKKVAVNIRDFEDVNLKDVLDAARKNEQDMMEARRDLDGLSRAMEEEIQAVLEENRRRMDLIDADPLSPEDREGKRRSIRKAEAARIARIRASRQPRIDEARRRVDEVQKKIDAYDSRMLARAREQEEVLDNQRRLAEIELQNVKKYYEERISSMEKKNSQEVAALREHEKEMVRVLQARHAREIERLTLLYNPKVTDEEVLFLLEQDLGSTAGAGVGPYRDLLSREGVMGRQDYAALGRVAAGYDRLAAEMAKVQYKNSVPPILRQMASGHRSLLLRYEKLWNGLADGMEKKNGIIADRERSLESYTQALEYFLKMSRENGFIIDPRDPEKIVVFMDKIRIIPDGTLGLVFRRDDEYIGRVRFRDQQDRLVASLVDLVDTGNQMKPFDIILVQEQ